MKYNGASLRPKIPRNLVSLVCKTKKKKCKDEPCMKHKTDMHALYIDDLSEAEAIELKKQLIPDPVQRPFPLNFHERTQHIYPTDNSLLQKQLLKVESFTIQNQMRINESKSKVMIFNKSRKFDCHPNLPLEMVKILR